MRIVFAPHFPGVARHRGMLSHFVFVAIFQSAYITASLTLIWPRSTALQKEPQPTNKVRTPRSPNADQPLIAYRRPIPATTVTDSQPSATGATCPQPPWPTSTLSAHDQHHPPNGRHACPSAFYAPTTGPITPRSLAIPILRLRPLSVARCRAMIRVPRRSFMKIR